MKVIAASRKKAGLRHVKRSRPHGPFNFSYITFPKFRGFSYTREEAQAMLQRCYTEIPGLEPLRPSAQGQ